MKRRALKVFLPVLFVSVLSMFNCSGEDFGEEEIFGNDISKSTEQILKEEASQTDFVIDESGVLTSYKGYAKKVVIPERVEKINFGVFLSHLEIEEVTFPKNLKIIDECAFYDCSGIKLLKLPDSLEKIGRLAFGNCASVSDMYIGKNLNFADELFVWGCSKMEKIEVSPKNRYYSSLDGILYNKKLTELCVCPEKCKEKVIVPKSVTTIKEFSFFECKNLKEVVFGKNVMYVDEGAFGGCQNLKFVEMNDSVKKIRANAFSECASLEKIVIGDSVVSLGNMAFYNCSLLKEVIFMSKDIEIGNKIFAGCCNNIKIKAPKDSTAQAYAIKHGCEFESIK